MAPGLPGPRKPPRSDEAAAAAAAALPKLVRRAKGPLGAARAATSSSSATALSSKASPEPLLALVLRLARRRTAALPKAAVAVGLVPAGDKPSVVLSDMRRRCACCWSLRAAAEAIGPAEAPRWNSVLSATEPRRWGALSLGWVEEGSPDILWWAGTFLWFPEAVSSLAVNHSLPAGSRAGGCTRNERWFNFVDVGRGGESVVTNTESPEGLFVKEAEVGEGGEGRSKCVFEEWRSWAAE